MIQRWLDGEAPSNVWVGTTVEDQQRADERIPALLAIPAHVRFLSCEPLLEAVDLTRWLRRWTLRGHSTPTEPCTSVRWVICGGESGPKARPMKADWARALRDQCAAAGVPFFMKQMGGAKDKRGDLDQIPEDLRIREIP